MILDQKIQIQNSDTIDRHKYFDNFRLRYYDLIKQKKLTLWRPLQNKWNPYIVRTTR